MTRCVKSHIGKKKAKIIKKWWYVRDDGMVDTLGGLVHRQHGILAAAAHQVDDERARRTIPANLTILETHLGVAVFGLPASPSAEQNPTQTTRISQRHQKDGVRDRNVFDDSRH